ncbi:MAG: hypothetical protein JWO99_610 [Candidatus Saccharibacteria bacterium]|nr:hypothetical protein [Candidatus Saccharibacteria bacterium]
MEPTTTPQPQLRQNKHVLIKIIVAAVILAVIAGIALLVYRSVHQAVLESDVKTELIKQNKIITLSAKGNIFPSSVPAGVKSTDKVVINASVSASGTAYCIAGTSKSDAKIVFHMDKSTPEDAPVKGSCSDSATVPPLTPSEVAIGSVGAGAVSLSWQTAPYAASYTVQCANDKDFTIGLKSKTTDTTAITLSDLGGDGQYYCRVSASNSLGQSAWSPTLSAMTNPISVAPTEMKVTTVSSTALHYSWKATDGALSYVVEYSEDDSFVKDVTRLTTTATSGDATGLKAYTAYYFHVKAVTAGFDADHASFSTEELGRTAKP